MSQVLKASRRFAATVIEPPDPKPDSPPPPPEPTIADERRQVIRAARATYRAHLLPWKVLIGAAAGGVYVHGAGYGWSTLMLALLLAGGGYLITDWRLTRRGVTTGKIELGQTSGRRVRSIKSRARRSAKVGAGLGVWLTAAAVTNPAALSGQLVWAAGAIVWALVSAEGWWRPADTGPTDNKPARTATRPPASMVDDDDDDAKPGPRPAPYPPNNPIARRVRAAQAASQGVPDVLGPAALPDPELLKTAQRSVIVVDDDLTAVIQTVLDEHHVDAKVVEAQRSASITRYGIQPAPGVPVNKVLQRRQDIAYACGTDNIRVLAPIEGQRMIGIEVPNATKDLVSLHDVLASPPALADLHPMIVAMGMDTDGRYVVANLVDLPHVLIGGSTNSGKSSCINSMLVSILTRATPDEVRLMLIDPKRVELTPYQGVPHLLVRVITEPSVAVSGLQYVVEEMRRRYRLLEAATAQNIKIYNRKVDKGEADGPKLAYWLIVIDELADLIRSAYKEDIEHAIADLGALARAVGIHLVLATQHPLADVVTSVIKANMPSRIGFKTSSQSDSRVIIDENGAEKLLGRGDALFKPLGASKPIRIQGCYVGETERDAVVAHWRGIGHGGATPAVDLVMAPAPVITPQTNREKVLDAALRGADPDGTVTKETIIALTPTVKDATRNDTLTGLFKSEDLIKLKNKRYAVASIYTGDDEVAAPDEENPS
jgi:hypothetical protein